MNEDHVLGGSKARNGELLVNLISLSGGRGGHRSEANTDCGQSGGERLLYQVGKIHFVQGALNFRGVFNHDNDKPI